jgi:Alpha/beta hydrolase domain
VRDRNGNASGGVRTTVLDVATATVVPTSLNPGGVPGNPCAYVGYQLNFSRDLLERRYHSHGGYVRRVVRVARSLVRHHWLLPADARNEVVTAVRSDVLR